MIDHCEDPSLFAGGVMREGPHSVRLGLKGIPAQSESICVGRDVEVALLTGARLHIAHMSTAARSNTSAPRKSSGLRVTCEVTPHHFTLTDEDVRYDSHYKMNPPLASRDDRDALIAGLADGSVDAIATDHAPHHPASKDVEFDRAPFGITGFETALALGLSELVHTGKLSLMRLVELFTTGPARVLGIERKIAAGEPADLTIFSTDHQWTFRAAESPSKSRNTPFDGRAFRGAPMATIVAGRIVLSAVALGACEVDCRADMAAPMQTSEQLRRQRLSRRRANLPRLDSHRPRADGIRFCGRALRSFPAGDSAGRAAASNALAMGFRSGSGRR